jgi:(p)ppGpp synthase/HD superfamily hydrolase
MKNWSQDSYIKACRFAAEAHQGQCVPGTELPYLVHLSMVSMEVVAAASGAECPDADLAVQCAWLHDTIEDTAITYEQVLDTFGAAVAKGVSALTKDASLDKSLQMADSLRRIRLQPKAVWMVKLADRITNLQPPPAYWTKEKAARYRDEAVQIHAALKDADEALAARLMARIEAYRVFTE